MLEINECRNFRRARGLVICETFCKTCDHGYNNACTCKFGIEPLAPVEFSLPGSYRSAVSRLLDALQFLVENDAEAIDLNGLATDDPDETFRDMISAAINERQRGDES